MIRYLPETFKIFCNMAVSLSNWLSRKIEQSSISDKAKLVLFGIASPTPIQDFAKKSEIPTMNYSTREEILALFDDETSEIEAGADDGSGDV